MIIQYDVLYEKTKQWYDGYELKDIHIYNPRPVVISLIRNNLDSYLTKTET